jgi:hypothetical protein
VRARRVPVRAEGLEARPDGKDVLLLDPLVVVPGGGVPFSLGGEASGGSWSPDGRWLVLARGDRLELVELDGEGRISLPVAAHSVAWR